MAVGGFGDNGGNSNSVRFTHLLMALGVSGSVIITGVWAIVSVHSDQPHNGAVTHTELRRLEEKLAVEHNMIFQQIEHLRQDLKGLKRAK